MSLFDQNILRCSGDQYPASKDSLTVNQCRKDIDKDPVEYIIARRFSQMYTFHKIL